MIRDLLRALPAKRREEGIWLLTALLGVTRSSLLLAADDPLDPAKLALWQEAWKRREAGEPLQYIAGRAPFFGREFSVDPAVLIPRPETERLVELCLGLFPVVGRIRALDIGTGSGAIAATLKLERPLWRVTGSDVSPEALAIAKSNGTALGASVDWECHDLFSPALAAREWDLVVSNPPYLEFGRDKISAEVERWEPRMALEPREANRVAGCRDRAAWCAEAILLACREACVRFTALELSPRVARSLELRWRRQSGVKRVWREADLAGRKRFLLVAWADA